MQIVTHLTFGFFNIGFDALHLFPAVDTEAEVDALETVIPLLESSSTVTVAEASKESTPRIK